MVIGSVELLGDGIKNPTSSSRPPLELPRSTLEESRLSFFNFSLFSLIQSASWLRFFFKNFSIILFFYIDLLSASSSSSSPLSCLPFFPYFSSYFHRLALAALKESSGLSRSSWQYMLISAVNVLPAFSVTLSICGTKT